MRSSAAGLEIDGRRHRRERNREAVIDALLDLFRAGVYQPSSNDIAERAGLSPRSLFRYFDDIDDLLRAAIDRQLAAAQPLLELGIGAGAPTADKVRQLAETRVRLFETIGPAARAARVAAHRQPMIAGHLRDSRAFLRNQLASLFAPELDHAPTSRLAAIDAVCSFEAVELMRGDQGLSRPKTVAALVDALGALLIPSGG